MTLGFVSALAHTASTTLGVVTIIIALVCLVAYVKSRNAPQPIRMMFLVIILLAGLTYVYAAYHHSLESRPVGSEPEESQPPQDGSQENGRQSQPQTKSEPQAVEDGPGGGAPRGEQPQ